MSGYGIGMIYLEYYFRSNSNNQLFVLPPDLAKYTSIMSDEDFRNIEIKKV